MNNSVLLGALISPAHTARCGNLDLPVLSMTMHDGLILQKDRFNKIIASKDMSQYKIVNKNQLVVSFPIDEGVLAVQSVVSRGIVSPAYAIWDIDQSKVIPAYLEMALRAPKSIQYYKSKLKGTTARRRSIRQSDFLSMSFLLPPLKEQYDILERIEVVKQFISQKNEQLFQLDQLAKSRFIEMFGDGVDPNLFPIVKLSDIAEKISDGVHAKPEYTPTGKPFLSVVNIVKGFVDFSDCKYVSEDAYQKMIRSTHPQRGDVLYTKVGATYGVPAYVDSDRDFCLYVSVCLIKPNHSKVNSRFLAFSMKMPYVKRQADARIKGIGVPDLHLNQIRNFDIILPSFEKQNEFVAFIEQLDKSKVTIQKSLDKLNLLYKALLQEYFG